jgi:hypothetical protein
MARNSAVQRAAAADGAGASLEPKHDHACGAGHGPLAEGNEEQQRVVQQQDEEQQREARQQEGEQQREAQRVPASRVGCGAGAATAVRNEAAAGGCDGPIPKQTSAEARLHDEARPHGEARDEPTEAASDLTRKEMKKKEEKKEKREENKKK